MSMFVVWPASWSAEFNVASYTVTTLQEIIIAEEQNRSLDQTEAANHAVRIQLEYGVFKYRVPCCYSNVQRPISEKKKNVITMWMESLKIDPQIASLYQQEIQVTEGMRILWIPIQEQLFPHIHQELVINDKFELFIIFIGKVESDFLFIATEFQNLHSPVNTSLQATACERPAP